MMLEELSKLADTCQYKAYQLSYEDRDDDVCWWGLHESISLFDYYIKEECEDNYMDMVSGLLEMLAEIPEKKVNADFQELIKQLKILEANDKKV